MSLRSGSNRSGCADLIQSLLETKYAAIAPDLLNSSEGNQSSGTVVFMHSGKTAICSVVVAAIQTAIFTVVFTTCLRRRLHSHLRRRCICHGFIACIESVFRRPSSQSSSQPSRRPSSQASSQSSSQQSRRPSSQLFLDSCLCPRPDTGVEAVETTMSF